MTWRADGPQGNEARKVRFDVLPYLHAGVDIGCGPAKVWPHLIGLDSTKDTRLFGIPMEPDIVIKDAAQLGIFADGAMQCVFSSHTLEHIEDHKAALAEWWRLVKEDGFLVLYLPHRDLYPRIGHPGANPDHKHDFAPADIIEALEGIGPDWSLLVNEVRSGGDEYSFLQVFRKEAPGHGQRHPWVQPKPAKTAGVVRVGGHGDALWASSILPQLKAEGYHVTVYAAVTGAEILKHDPHIDALVRLPTSAMTEEEILEYWGHIGAKHDRFINLVGSVEDELLWHPSHIAFYRPHWLRQRIANRNYLERVHEFAGLPYVPAQKFYPTESEVAAARKLRELVDGPLVVIAPAGSGAVKYWPHSQRLMERLAERGVYSVVLGSITDPGLTGVDPYGSVVAMDWPVRIACAFAQMADAVVATESLFANVVAFEPLPKVVTLSHSSRENLTRDWVNCVSIEPTLECAPCHRIHSTFDFCSRDTATKAAACQAIATADTVADVLFDLLKIPAPREAATA